MSYTLCFDGTSNILESTFHPPIDLDDGEWVLALLSLQTYHTVPNINENNNKFAVVNPTDTKKMFTFTLPTGAYTIDHLNDLLRGILHNNGIKFELSGDITTQRVIMFCDTDVIFTIDNDLHELLGFDKKVYKKTFITFPLITFK